MGVTQASKYLHSVSKLTLVEIASICTGLARELGILPRVVVDCSNLAFIYTNYISPTDAVAKHLARFAAPGIVIVPVCDGVSRVQYLSERRTIVLPRKRCAESQPFASVTKFVR